MKNVSSGRTAVLSWWQQTVSQAGPVILKKVTGKPSFRLSRALCLYALRLKMVMINGIPYLDGGCSDKVPFRWPLDQGYQKVLVIRTRPMDYRKKERSDHSLTDRLYHELSGLCPGSG